MIGPMEILTSDQNSKNYLLTNKDQVQVLLFENYVPAGFPSPAETYTEGPLNLHDYLVKKPAATFFVRVTGDSMVGAGIFKGDLLVVDKSLEPAHRSIVIAAVDGEFTVKRLIKRQGQILLQAENPNYPDRLIQEGNSFEIWGVVCHCIHDLRNT